VECVRYVSGKDAELYNIWDLQFIIKGCNGKERIIPGPKAPYDQYDVCTDHLPCTKSFELISFVRDSVLMGFEDPDHCSESPIFSRKKWCMLTEKVRPAPVSPAYGFLWSLELKSKMAIAIPLEIFTALFFSGRVMVSCREKRVVEIKNKKNKPMSFFLYIH